MLAFISSVAAPAAALAETKTAPPLSTNATGQYQDVWADGGRALTLLANAPPAPEIYGSFEHFGLAISPPEQFSTHFRTIRIDYDAMTPHGSAALVDVRASADGVRWSAWEIDLASGASATFAQPARFAQYRVILLGNGPTGPAIESIRLTSLNRPATYAAMADAAPPVAPTFRIHATRQGMVGHRTSNGHRIARRDHYVSLPSRRALASNGGSEYLVRITYNGRSTVAPVYDVGPWNIHDNYWDEQRERFGDLPRGYPEDHAAYFDKYNGGRAEKGRVRFPTAIDVGDGAWLDDLKIRGDRAVVEVTFLWLGTDPLAPPPPPPPADQPPPAPANQPAPPPPADQPAPPPPADQPSPPPADQPAPPATAAPAPSPTAEPTPSPTAEPTAKPAEVVVDERAKGFKGEAKVKWYDGPDGCGEQGHALWTYTATGDDDSENVGRWQPKLDAEAMYDVYVGIPGCAGRKPNTAGARYRVHHRDGDKEIVVDQAASAGQWVLLGRFPFRKGDDGFVELRDRTGEDMLTIWFDAVRWVPAKD